MFQASKSHQEKAIAIITTTFNSNPSVNIVIGSNGDRSSKIKALSKYAFIKAYNRNGAFISENQKGIGLVFLSDQTGINLSEILAELNFAFKIGLKQVKTALKREVYIKKHRYQKRHLYFWFLGVEKGGDQAVFEMKDQIFNWSKNEQLPILLETSVERNKNAYERYGFQVYHEWKNGEGNTLWFMIRQASN